jgi:zinc finger protein
MHNGLKQASPFASKDSTNHGKFDKFLSELKNMAEGNRLPFTLIITDPISNSFVESGQSFVQQADQSISDDKRLSIEEFQRSREEDDRFGLSDMKTS